jgi:hypothetical protein
MTMHDIDRTMGRTNMEASEFQAENEMGEYEYENEAGESELNEMASELLSVTNERELEQFLGDIFNKVTSAVGNFARSPVGQQVGGILKNVARTALPIAGQALGNYIAPGVGGQIGGQLASAAGSMFGLELEGLSHEDREFEVAKQFVRLAADAAQTAAQAPPGSNPAAVAQHAIASAAEKFAPGLLEPSGGHAAEPSPGPMGGRGSSGRWVRKGNKLIVYGI